MNPIVSTDWLAAKLTDPDLVVADVRWQHGKPDAGRTAYTTARIPGAVFLDLDTDLSDRSDPELIRGRHPLPDAQRFVDSLADAGIGRGTTVVVYDGATGSIASRLWFMLRWVGHTNVAVLDGGMAKWVAENRPTDEAAPATRTAHSQPIIAQPNDSLLLPTKSAVAAALARGTLLLDARAPERFRGEHEPIDKHAGRIAGAVNAPFDGNLRSREVGTMHSPDELRTRFQSLGVTQEAEVACYCGSGVTACHDLLALAIAGFTNTKLYPGSWSEWSLDPLMPTATD